MAIPMPVSAARGIVDGLVETRDRALNDWSCATYAAEHGAANSRDARWSIVVVVIGRARSGLASQQPDEDADQQRHQQYFSAQNPDLAASARA